ncbi:MAG TPA: zf-HC2 domain-containing protein, partial [Anaeromyxobacteraceae bacterium]|nr:zf-HC2 domain-containing protein [Anaeromyxobacteraceae bacterium]
MNHEAASERLLELAYGDLPPREARAVEAHAAACDACRAELARMRETRALMARLPVEPPPEGGMAVVMAAARQAAEASPRRRTILPAWLWAGGIGAVAAAAVAVVSWQLARTAPAVTGAERETELLGRGSSMGVPSSPPPGERVGASRQPAAPAPSDGIAPAPPPAERLGVREQPVASAPTKGIAPSPPPGERVGVMEQP